MYGYFKMSISDKVMSRVMYAIIITKSKLINSQNLGLEKYTRKQNSGNLVDVVIELDVDKVQLFEELSEINLKTSDEFQGKIKLN